MIEPGEQAPDFELPDQEGRAVKLSDFRGQRVVLYFYPKADTPGCTQEATAFNGLKRAFAKADTEIVGVSADPVKAQDKFRDKHDLAIALGELWELDVHQIFALAIGESTISRRGMIFLDRRRDC